jgi:hypothetical protein
MFDRSQQLARRAAQQVREFDELVRGLSSGQLAQPCPGEQEGDNVAVLIMRSTAVYERLGTILDAVRAHESARPGVRPAHGQRRVVRLAGPARGGAAAPADPAALAARLEVRGRALVERLQQLTAQQLARPLPMTLEGFDHMDKPIGMIAEYLLYCQAGRLEAIRRATAQRGAAAWETQPARWSPAGCRSLEQQPARAVPTAEAVCP